MRFLLFLILFAAVGLIPTACINDDFTTSPSDVLTFSTDVVSFDTVFTGVGTPTARLLVFNRAKKSINISSIRFAAPNTIFRMNVDGFSGKDFSDVEIRGNDSIYIFIECTPPETSGNAPTLMEDRIVFQTNGVTQEVKVEAWGQNVTRLKDYRVTSDMTLTADRPYIVFDSLVVDKGVKLSIEPGANVYFHDKGSLVVHGTLDARGTVDKPINMRSDRLDNVLPDVPYDLLAGQWDGIRLSEHSFDNRMEYVNMRSTVYGLVADSCAVDSRTKLTLVNSWLHNSQGNVLNAKYGNIDAYGCVFSDSPGAVVNLTGGTHKFVQCTIANYYLFSAIYQPLLTLSQVLADAEDTDPALPLMSASFENCIIYGLGYDINIGDLADSDVYMRNVLFKSEGSDDEHFIDCVWNADPLFYTVREEYYFNYRVKPDSPAIGAGNAAFVTPVDITDMDGVDRLADGAPTLGAYQYVPPKEDEEDKK